MASKAIGFLNFKFSADLTSFERAMRKGEKNYFFLGFFFLGLRSD